MAELRGKRNMHRIRSKGVLASLVLAGALTAGVLTPSAAAAAEDVVRITGGGWGHGLGMSQYGAYGRAQRGDSAEQILEHYYSGAEVSSREMPSRIRVGLLQSKKEIGITSSGDSGGKVVFKVAGSTEQVATGGAEATWRIEPSSTGGVRLFKNDEQVKESGNGVFGDADHALVLLYEPYGSAVQVKEKNRAYSPGRMEFGTYPSGSCDQFCLRLVIVLPMQKYLYGLGEVPSSWPQSALRSQAIAGRTYAYDKVQRSGQHREPCDCAVFDSTYDQAYIGDAKRDSYFSSWKEAVDETKKQVILYKSSPIQALYSSSSGGYTENNENVWGGTALPYLRGVKDKPDAVDANPNHTWSLEMTFGEFESKLNQTYHMGKLEDFQLLKPFGVSGRVTVVKSESAGGVRITGSEKVVRESGWSIRNALGLKDSLFRVEITYGIGEQFMNKYRKLDRAPGRPTSRPYAVPRGTKKTLGQAQNFKKGRLTWRRSTDKVVWQWGPVLRKYNKLGREKSVLGMPTSDLWGPGSYRGANYAHGIIAWSKQTGGHTVRGGFLMEYRRRGGPQGSLGLPKTNRQKDKTLPHGGLRQRFTNGTIFLNPRAEDVFALWGVIANRYRKMGEARSECGYPTATMESGSEGAKASFENGTITTNSAGETKVECRRG
jgi:SpoIID/LytB domain protein